MRTTFVSIRSNYFQAEEMPTHCCVPEFTKKGYRKDDGTKVSYFKFPTENQMKKKWLHAIRRDEGKHFKVGLNIQRYVPGISGKVILKNLSPERMN